MRSQESFEFVTVIGITILFSLALLTLLGNTASQLKINAGYIQLETTATRIQVAIDQAVISPNDVTRFIEIPFANDVSLLDGYTLLITNEQSLHLHYFPYFVSGNACKGQNILFRQHNMLGICCNCSEIPITFPDVLMCSPSPYVWKPCAETKAYNMSGVRCRSSLQAEFNISANGTEELILSDDKVGDWIFLTRQLEGYNLSAECI